MARGAAQARRKGAKKPQPQRKEAAARRAPSVEDAMFFPRLRRQAKWMFVFLAFVFAAGFVFFGVGTGSGGLGDLLRGNFNIFGGDGTTSSANVGKALDRTKEHPNDPEAWDALATAYQTEGKDEKANSALERLLKLRPNDLDALQRVAGYYENKASEKDAEARRLYAEAPLTLASVAGVDPNSELGQIFTQDPVTQQVTQKANQLLIEAQTNLRKDEQLYKRIAKLQPDDVNTQFHFAQLADYLGETKDAIAAYRKVVALAPTDPSAAQARQRIAQLTQSSGTGG